MIVDFPSENKFLTAHPTFKPVITDVMVDSIRALDPCYAAHNAHAYVTSGLRDQEHQLTIIKNYAHLKALDSEFPNILKIGLHDELNFNGEIVFSWQVPWSRLLEMGEMISPPISAKCLFDYKHPTKGWIKAGTIRTASEHFCDTDVHPFDIGGGSDLKTSIIIVTEARQMGLLPEVIEAFIEHENNALHIRCTKQPTA
jgi:hypothetical protein